MNPPSALIVGVGYLGQHVARRWLAEGFQIWGTTRKRERFESMKSRGIIPIFHDVLVGGEALPAVDVVLYCVGFDSRGGESRHRVYVDGLAATLARLPRPKLFIYVSSTGVFGGHAGNWVDETTTADPLDEGGKACLEAENTLWSFARREGWDAIVLRLAGIYGPDRLMGRAALLASEPIAGDSDSTINLIHVEDAAEVVESARLRGKPGETYLVSDGVPLRRGEFYGALAEIVGAPPPRFDGTTPKRNRGDRRINSAKMRKELQPILKYADFQEGLRASLRSS